MSNSKMNTMTKIWKGVRVTMNLLCISLIHETRVNVREETTMKTYEASH